MSSVFWTFKCHPCTAAYHIQTISHTVTPSTSSYVNYVTVGTQLKLKSMTTTACTTAWTILAEGLNQERESKIGLSSEYRGGSNIANMFCSPAYTTLAVQIALWQSVISFTKITYHTAKIFRDFPCFYFMSFWWFYAHFG